MALSDVFGAMKRGFMFRCPQCGKGPLFRKYLKVQEICPVCGHDNGQYPADDGPAYFTILIMGHLVVVPMLMIPLILGWTPWQALSLVPVALIITLMLLPCVKGAIIGLMWALREAEGHVPGQEESELF